MDDTILKVVGIILIILGLFLIGCTVQDDAMCDKECKRTGCSGVICQSIRHQKNNW